MAPVTFLLEKKRTHVGKMDERAEIAKRGFCP